MEAQGASVVTFPQSMRFQPVAAHAGVGDQPDLELRGGLHALGDDRRDTLLLRAEHVDHQFVVHLQDHPRADAFVVVMAIFLGVVDLGLSKLISFILAA